MEDGDKMDMEDGDRMLLVPAAKIASSFPSTLKCTRCGSAESDGAARPRSNPLCHPHTCSQAHTSVCTCTNGVSLPFLPSTQNNSTMDQGYWV